MAAAKVFAVPELLEDILVKMALQEVHIGESTQQQYGPALSLFILQRVNTDFSNTIKGSIKLRRLMFLEFADPKSEEAEYLNSEESHEDSAYLRPLWWLFEFFRGTSSWRYMTQPCNDSGDVRLVAFTIDPNGGHLRQQSHVYCLQEDKQRAALREGASWRRMKLFRIPYEYILITQPILLLEPDSDGCDGRWLLLPDEDLVEVEVEVDSEWALADFWDPYHRRCTLEDERTYNRIKKMVESWWYERKRLGPATY
ncbi:Hypothetical predicted protein [Lecanosticta acicola]|uniref:Uncharacterized protein n=1 Tax=Lecanosticta acicola TaxID=111012 RepID=A0AAI8Z1Y9_9PEZI|nr:Hypothetical predicted protein [Lecanosticta acicola]